VRDHTLFFQRLLDRLNLVTKLRGRFELQGFGFLLHSLPELGNEFLLPAFDEQHRLSYLFPVFLRRDRKNTWSEATLDLILQAWPRAVLEITVFALAHLKHFLQQVKTVTHRHRAGKRTEITPTFTLGAAMK
jgi:hypothetical protein